MHADTILSQDVLTVSKHPEMLIIMARLYRKAFLSQMKYESLDKNSQKLAELSELTQFSCALSFQPKDPARVALLLRGRLLLLPLHGTLYDTHGEPNSPDDEFRPLAQKNAHDQTITL